MTAIDAGVRMIGENRPQEVTAKAEGLLKQCAQRGFTFGGGHCRGGLPAARLPAMRTVRIFRSI